MAAVPQEKQPKIFHLLKTSRLEGLYDGIFAIAMTILVLDLRMNPTLELQNTTLTSAILTIVLPKLLIYIGSFIILGTHWVAMNFQMGLLKSLNRPYLWMHIFYLMGICVIPFSASLMAYHTHNKVSIWFYAINLMYCSVLQMIIFFTACYYNLNHFSITKRAGYAVYRRALVAPVFYLLSLLVSEWDSQIAFICLVFPTLIYLIPGHIDRFEETEYQK